MEFFVRRTERDHREAAGAAGLGLNRYSGLARSQEEAHEITKSRGEDRPDKPLAFDDGGAADRKMALRAGITEEAWEKRQWRQARKR